MERSISVEEKIRRAEEIYARRQGNNHRKTTTVTVNNSGKKEIKIIKKILIQIFISTCIYIVIYTININNYDFSNNILNQTNKILSYDMDFNQIYIKSKQKIEKVLNKLQNKESIEEQKKDQNSSKDTKIDNEKNEKLIKKISQEEIDIKNIKKTATFVKPVAGVISSGYGKREPSTKTVPKNHTGVDIAAKRGTKIISATDGEVVLKSKEGDYGKHIKIQKGEIAIIYAHCSKILVKQGDKVKQGQKIAEVGSTGNSTGPHLHFEIRYQERTVDPQKILKL